MLDKRKEQSDIPAVETPAPENNSFPDINFDNGAVPGAITKDDLPF